MNPIYAVRDISFVYPSSNRPVLDGVSLELEAGGLLTILGRNGAGKSTLLHCMLGLLKPQRGDILLNGRDLASLQPRDVTSLVGFVPQTQTPVFEHTVFDFVQMGCASRIGLFSRPGKRERDDTAAILADMGIASLADRPVTLLSGGEQQQAVIARALVTRPPVVLFDEPTAHLDFGNQVRVLRIIKSLAQKGFAVVLTTHNPDHALLLGGRAALLDSGGHLRSGPADELLTEETLQEVYGADLRLVHVAELRRKVCVYPEL